jgi:hypothetical protein
VRLAVKADVIPHILVKPAPRVILRGIVGDNIRQALQIRSGDDHHLEISGIKSSLDKWIDYNLRRREDGQTYDLEVISKATERVSTDGYLRLHTNHPKKKEITLRVAVRVTPELEVWPSRINFGKLPRNPAKDRPIKWHLTLTNHRGQKFSLGEIRYNKDHFDVKAVPLGGNPSTRHRLEVTPRLDRLPAGTTTDTLIIRTDWPKAREFKVPMNILVEG